MASHSGGWAGYISYIERHLGNDKTIIVLQNQATRKSENPIKNTRNVLYGLPIEKKFQLSDEILSKYAGTYISYNDREEEILFEDGKLWVPLNPEVNLDLIPVSETKFIVNGFNPEISYEFILDEKGDVLKYRAQQPEQGIDITSMRKK